MVGVDPAEELVREARRLDQEAGVTVDYLDSEAVRRFDADHSEMLAQRFPRDPLEIPHRVWVLVARCP